jgi:hypothetical protein
MTPRAARWVLWVTFAVAVPLPFFLAETGRVPAARLLMLGAVAAAVIVAEGSQGAVGIAAGLLFGQALLWLALLWLAASLVSRALRLGSPRTVAAVTAVVVAGILAAATVLEPYHTPFRTRSLRANLLHVYE